MSRVLLILCAGLCGCAGVHARKDAAPPAKPPPVTEECVVCHADVEIGWRRGRHFPAVGCVACHGPGEDHMGVEDNSVLPERPLADADADLCLSCHHEDVSDKQDHPAGAEAGPCAACHPPH